MSVSKGPDNVEDGLIVILDAVNIKSYPGSGTTWHNLVGTNNATLTGSPSVSGGGMQFNGSSQYATIPQDTLTNFSVSVWYKTLGSGGRIFNLAWYSNGNTHWDWIVTDPYSTTYVEGGWAYSRNGGSRNDMSCGNSAYSNGNWKNITLTIVGNTAQVYYDGVKGNSDTFSISDLGAAGSTSFTIGRGRNYMYNSGTWGYANCSVPLVHMWNKTLTDNEALQSYNSLKGRFV